MALFHNRQWRVTGAGIESISGPAHRIKAERLLETTTRQDGVFYD